MKFLYTFVLNILFFAQIQAQCNTQFNLISAFYWDDSTQAVTTADKGPDGIAASPFATIDVGGNNGTTGLNPGPNQINIDLILPGAAFNLDGIDISVDYQREGEGQASFYTRGTGPYQFNFGQPSGGNLSVQFALHNGGLPITINSGNIYSIPDDDIYRTYRFNYDPCTGMAKVMVDGVTVYTYNGTPGWVLYWEPTDVVIGQRMDAYGNNVTLLDNVEVQAPTILLPLELTQFEAAAQGTAVHVNWATKNEPEQINYWVERSADGINFESVHQQAGLGQENYHFVDEQPINGTSYYRLVQEEMDGTTTKSKTVAVSFERLSDDAVSVFPMPVTSNLNVSFSETLLEQNQNAQVEIINMQGQILLQKSINTTTLASLDLAELNAGTYILRVHTEQNTFSKMIQKQ